MVDWNETPIGDYDARALFGDAGVSTECPLAPIDRQDVVRVVHCHRADGDYAETSIHAIFELQDGRFAFVSAWCDTTGWDCQSNANWAIADSLENLWPQIGDEARTLFGQPSDLQRRSS